MYPSSGGNIQKSSTTNSSNSTSNSRSSSSSTSTSATNATRTGSRYAISLFMMQQQQQQQQRSTISSSRSSPCRISTEKIFVFILVVSVSCFQLALHYSSMDTIQRMFHDYDDHGDGDDRYSNNNHNHNNIHLDDGEVKNSVMESSSKKTTTTTTHRPGSTTTRNNHHHHHHRHLRLANKDVCINIRSQKTAPASMQPKIDIEPGQGYIARGGYEAIAKGSGPIYAATGLYVNLLSHIQHVDLHLFGTVAELGVHHGRFTSVLFITARVTEKLVVVDLFDELQNFNVDLSGRGNYNEFVHGMSRYGLQAELDLYRIYKTSTDQLPFNWVDRDGLEPFRLVSLDAGHTAALTLNDLQLDFCNLLKGGVVIIDDWFHPRWPGVVEGFYEFAHRFHHHHPQQNNNNNNHIQMDVYPFLLCESKLYVTNDKDAHHLYMERIVNDPSSLSEWASPFAHEASSSHVEKNNTKTVALMVWFEMNGGIPYLRCDSSRLPSSSSRNVTQQIWLDRLY